MTPQHSLQRLEKYFEVEGAVDDSKGALPEGCGEAAGIFPAAGLAWSDDDCRRRWVEPPEKLQDSRSCGATTVVLMEGNLQIHDRNVYRLMLDQRGSFLAGVSLQGVNAHRLKQPGDLLDSRVFSPPAI